MSLRVFALFCAILLTIGSAIQKNLENQNRTNSEKISIFKK